MKVKKIPFPEFKSIYTSVPRLCVEVVLYTKKEGVLLIKRTIAPAIGFWHVPGGTVLKGETLQQAVKRVAKEELGVDVIVKEFVGIIEYSSYDKNHYSQDISLAFLVDTKKRDFKLDGHADQYDFFKKIPLKTIKEQEVFLNTFVLK